MENEERLPFEGRYDFIFKGHQFVHSDVAKDQSKCPHCDAEAVKHENYKRAIHPMHDDRAGTFRLIGFKILDYNGYAVCFECQNCFHKLFYHMSDDTLIMLLRKHGYLAEYIDKIREIQWELADDEMKWILHGIKRVVPWYTIPIKGDDK